MTVTLVNERKDKQREFESKEEAEEQRSKLIGLGVAPEDLKIKENGDATAENVDEPPSKEPKQPKEAVPVEAEAVEQSESEIVDIQGEEQFVTDVKGVPETFVVNMGTKDNKSIHIKKEGYYYLASKMDIDYGAEPIKSSVELDNQKAIYRGWAEKDGQRWENVGTAHLDGEDMQGAKYNLDELAATRAACRALSMATGTGVASMEEMNQQ